MPTNPLWVEHTERAAWDTVEALREQIEREREKNERLTRLQPLLPKLGAALALLKNELGSASDDPVELVTKLIARAGELRTQTQTLERELTERSRELDRVRAVEGATEDAARAAESASSQRWFSSLLAKRAQKSPVRPKLEAQRLIHALEHKTDELSGARPEELIELAVDIGYLALLLARSARRAKKRRAP